MIAGGGFCVEYIHRHEVAWSRSTLSNLRQRWQFHLSIGLLIGLILGIPAAQIAGRLGAFLPWSGSGNLVRNGSFEHLDRWDYIVRPGSSAEFSQDSGQHVDGLYSLKADIMLAAPANPWYIQVDRATFRCTLGRR